MKSEDKFDVVFLKKTNRDGSEGRWVGAKWKRDLERDVFVPSFEDWYRLIVPVCQIEDEKYPPELGYKGRKLVEEFFVDCCSSPTIPFDELRKKYRIPTQED